MSTQAATVESLTATVRILQVGSRQVTLSMVKQLDRVHHSQLEAWGRVRVRLDGDEVAREYAIGVNGSGELALGGPAYFFDGLLPLIVLGGAR